mgnify:FL=1
MIRLLGKKRILRGPAGPDSDGYRSDRPGAPDIVNCIPDYHHVAVRYIKAELFSEYFFRHRRKVVSEGSVIPVNAEPEKPVQVKPAEFNAGAFREVPGQKAEYNPVIVTQGFQEFHYAGKDYRVVRVDVFAEIPEIIGFKHGDIFFILAAPDAPYAQRFAEDERVCFPLEIDPAHFSNGAKGVHARLYQRVPARAGAVHDGSVYVKEYRFNDVPPGNSYSVTQTWLCKGRELVNETSPGRGISHPDRDLCRLILAGCLLMESRFMNPYIRIIIIASCVLLYFFAAGRVDSTIALAGESAQFDEVWGYLMRGEEGRLRGDEPFTDICYFSIGVSYRGMLTSPVRPPEIKSTIKPRVHLVVTDLSNASLMHFCLNREYGVRDRLIDEIAAASRDFSGIQIDFESVAGDDACAFRDFLSALRQKLPEEKLLTVAVPARRKKVADAYNYEGIAAIADRVIIMAYDQHWSGSSPGPVASLPWCREVLAYALSAVPVEKLVMGLPLYGRSWQDRSYNRALFGNSIGEIAVNEKVQPEYNSESGPFISYEKKVQVKVYYENTRSTMEKLSLYMKAIRSVAFWRIGMNDGGLWRNVVLKK